MRSYPFTRLRVALAIGLLCGSTLQAQQTAASVRDRAKQEEDARNAEKAAQSFGMIDGMVSDTMLIPMHSAEVTVVGTRARVITGDNGRFQFQKVPPGQYLIVVRRIGYAPTSGMIEVSPKDTLRLSYTLARSIVAMDTIRVAERRVSLRMLEFEMRRKQGQGQFMTQEQIEKRNSLQAMDYLRQFSGINVSRITNSAFAGTIALSRREGGALQGGCAMQVVLDGIPMPANFNLELLPPPKQISGIEVYSGASTVPAQFSGVDRRCGLIAFWTRDGYY